MSRPSRKFAFIQSSFARSSRSICKQWGVHGPRVGRYERPTSSTVCCTICYNLYYFVWSKYSNLFDNFICNVLAGFFFPRRFRTVQENLSFDTNYNIVYQWFAFNITPTITNNSPRAGLTQWGARGTLKGRPCVQCSTDLRPGPTTHTLLHPRHRTSSTNSYTSMYCLGQWFLNFFESGTDRWFMMLFADHKLEM